MRTWTKTRLQQIKRNGRTEMDIVGEGLDMLLKLSQELTKGAWPHVVNNAIVSGEVQQTLIGLAGLWKGQSPTAAEGQSGPTLGRSGPAQGAIPPAIQEDHGSSPADGDVVGSDSADAPDAANTK